MTKHYFFAFLVLLLSSATGCLQPPVEENKMYQNEDYNGGLQYHPEQWGQRRTVRAAEFQEKQPQVVLQNDGSAGGLPEVRTVILTVTPSDTPALANNILRWVIDVGVGGANSRLVIDALGTQQVSLPSSKLTVSLMAEALDIEAPFVAPDVDYTASAFVALGNTSTPTAHYTTAATIGASSGTNLLIPAGATGFRVAGAAPTLAPTQSPFNAAVRYDIQTSTFADQYLGTDLEAIHESEGFIPLPGGARNMSISSGNAASTTVIVVWQLDL
jgi:hypothetical protein